MNTIRQARTLKLNWLKPSSFRREYHLFSDKDQHDLLALIRWDKTFSSLATAESADGKWTFKRQGFLHPCVAIQLAKRKEESGENNNKNNNNDLAVLHINWDGSGVLDLQESDSGGRKYRWKRVDFWHTEYTFAKMNRIDDNGGQHVLLHFKPEFKFAKLEGTVYLSQDALLLPEVSLLVLLGLYLLVLIGDNRKQL